MFLFIGAFVAGTDAGKAYNTFPKMGDVWIPETILELTVSTILCIALYFDHELYSLANVSQLFWKCSHHSNGSSSISNDDHHGVCNNHLPIFIINIYFLYSVSVLYGLARRKFVWRQLPSEVRASLNTTMTLALLQVSLGISTLVYCVPIDMAIAHQTGALVLFTSMLKTCHTLKFTKF